MSSETIEYTCFAGNPAQSFPVDFWIMYICPTLITLTVKKLWRTTMSIKAIIRRVSRWLRYRFVPVCTPNHDTNGWWPGCILSHTYGTHPTVSRDRVRLSGIHPTKQWFVGYVAQKRVHQLKIRDCDDMLVGMTVQWSPLAAHCRCLLWKTPRLHSAPRGRALWWGVTEWASRCDTYPKGEP